MSAIIDIADALVAALNGEVWDPEFVAVRSYQPAYELPDLSALRVVVVPKSRAAVPATRNDDFVDCTIDVALAKKVAPTATAEMDGLMTLAEQIGDFLRGKQMSTASWVKTETDPIYLPDLLAKSHTFMSVLRVTYRVRR